MKTRLILAAALVGSIVDQRFGAQGNRGRLPRSREILGCHLVLPSWREKLLPLVRGSAVAWHRNVDEGSDTRTICQDACATGRDAGDARTSG